MGWELKKRIPHHMPVVSLGQMVLRLLLLGGSLGEASPHVWANRGKVPSARGMSRGSRHGAEQVNDGITLRD